MQERLVTLTLLLAASSGLFDEFRFQPHGSKAIDLAGNVVVTVYQSNVFDLGPRLHRFRGAFDGKVFYDHNAVAIGEDRTIDIAHHLVLFGFHPIILQGVGIPRMAAFRTIHTGAI